MHCNKTFFGLVGLLILCACSLGLCAQETRKALTKPTPKYPEIAKRMNLSGTVKIEITVGPNGEVKDTNVLGGHPLLIDAALEAVKKWKYEPAKTETVVTVQFEFHP